MKDNSFEQAFGSFRSQHLDEAFGKMRIELV